MTWATLTKFDSSSSVQASWHWQLRRKAKAIWHGESNPLRGFVYWLIESKPSKWDRANRWVPPTGAGLNVFSFTKKKKASIGQSMFDLLWNDDNFGSISPEPRKITLVAEMTAARGRTPVTSARKAMWLFIGHSRASAEERVALLIKLRWWKVTEITGIGVLGVVSSRCVLGAEGGKSTRLWRQLVAVCAAITVIGLMCKPCVWYRLRQNVQLNRSNWSHSFLYLRYELRPIRSSRKGHRRQKHHDQIFSFFMKEEIKIRTTLTSSSSSSSSFP